MPVAAFKIGVLGSVENVLAVAEITSDYPEIPLIFDPVLASGRGDTLSGEAIISAIREILLPQTTLLTPNAPEARRARQPGVIEAVVARARLDGALVVEEERRGAGREERSPDPHPSLP